MTKSKRDITFGEMQDECVKHGTCEGVEGIMLDCPYNTFCNGMMSKQIGGCDGSMYADYISPCNWNLTDAPRFTDAQKEFLRGWMAIGAVEAHKCTITDEGDPFDVIDFYDADASCIGTVVRLYWLEEQIEFGEAFNIYDAIGDEPCAK